jgi:hypothetical protein
MILSSFALVLLMPTAWAAGSVCSSGIYALLAPLGGYPPAQSYCLSHFAPRTVTKTFTAPGSTSTATTTDVIPPAKRHVAAAKDPQASLFSLLVAEADEIVSTFCSCIETPVTTTVSYGSRLRARNLLT